MPVSTSGFSHDSQLYCKRCNKIVEEPLMNFTFDMTVFNLFENVVETVSVYDKVAENFIGLTPKELVKVK